jgi:hypothetical protein
MHAGFQAWGSASDYRGKTNGQHREGNSHKDARGTHGSENSVIGYGSAALGLAASFNNVEFRGLSSWARL